VKRSGDKTDNQKSRDLSVTAPLFPDFCTAAPPKVRTYKRIDQPIWTEHKAQFIRHYLRYFVQITKHGAYIDGFAGPQSFEHLEAWSASLVLESDPKWLRSFFLCELSARGVKALRQLVDAQAEVRDKNGRRLNRKIEVLPGDFNRTINTVLCNEKIAQKEATFCLLDQRTFECHWATLERLTAFKQPPHNKIELLYFLGVGWIHRAFAGIRDTEILLKWWGRTDWGDLRTISSWEIAELVRLRFEKELGYRFAAAYPIFDRDDGNRVMYYMIHASDHEEAPALMVRAHARAVRALSPQAQGSLNFPDGQ
jgi:three-Cys-motif partner protein